MSRALDLGDGTTHRPKVHRPHIAQEYREDRGMYDAVELCWQLMPHLKHRALGVSRETTLPERTQ